MDDKKRINEPLGHLLSLFMRRCPTIPAEGERPPLPADFLIKLKTLTGRARELLANRMAVQMNYFARADKEWLDEEVLLPMTKDESKSDRLWEAFAKYSRIPPPRVWDQLQIDSFRRLYSPSLSPEALRRLAEINVVIWIWSKEASSGFRVDTTKMRTAFGLANEAVRGAAAWQFSAIFRSKEDVPDPENAPWPKFGPLFFREIWPLEPALQSAQSANDFARIPVHVGTTHFGDAMNIVLPYLLPFEVWSVSSEFGLDLRKDTTRYILKHFPSEVLALISACISERQQHAVYDLGDFLDQLVAENPELRRDSRTRFLRKLSVQRR